MIQYLQRHELDEARWNSCISSADNGLVYAYSYYLDAMASNWDALVLNDYEAVMPLPWRKKWGVQYLYQPFLTAQLGVFGRQPDAEQIALFLTAVPKKFRYWDFSLNHQNLFSIEDFPLYQRVNFVLPLNHPYEEIFRSYRDNTRRNIRKSEASGCRAKKAIPLDNIIALTKLQAKEVPQQDFDNFSRVFQQMQDNGFAKTYGIVSQRGDLLASAAFLFSHNRAYYILVGNHPNGRTLGASHALIDAFVRDHSGKDLLLDFEGSDYRNLAFFYSSYGASQEAYAAIRLNRLPWWVRWMK